MTMPEPRVRYYFDVVCPYSYLLMGEVEALEDTGLDVAWVPFELRPAPDRLPRPRGRYIRDHWRGAVYPLAQAYDIEIHVPTVQPRSTLALSAALFADDKGAGRAMRDGLQRAFFVDGLDVSDEQVLRDVAEHARLDPDETVSAAWDPGRLAALQEHRSRAQELGVHGVPTLTVGDQVAFFGAPPPGRIHAAFDAAAGDPDVLLTRLRGASA